MKATTSLYSAILIAGTVACSSPALAEATGWVHPTEMEKISRQMSSRDMMPVSLQCRGSSKTSSVRESMEINMTFAANPKKIRWRWVWGSTYSSTKFQLEKQGWKQVASSGFNRPGSGLRVPCGIFHKS